MAHYRVNISAYNEAGESPRAIYFVPELSVTGTHLITFHRNGGEVLSPISKVTF